ncbi:MFS transporter [Plectonema cf. radiosum LEGE 06105]|uniref:MFS transporter n=1 Tax=Plectonema cf. radiosum LEGE 06105 TaxID=945769 RepID=A0A8J7F9I4_9CYAN|nr:MFS transporter [Plectonema radiosum]MBE9214114.1 MFS transporter [Plectonema cf. radiosum LEGE 06105]
MNNLSIPAEQKNTEITQDKNLYIIIGVTLISIMGGQTVAPILPSLTSVFNVSPREIELVMTLFVLPIGIATPILGVLADRIGIRKVLIPALILFAIAGASISFAGTFTSVLGLRFLQGLGAAPLDALALTMIAMLYNGRKLGAAMSINAAVIGISSAIYPLLGGALGSINWTYPFLLAVLAFPLVMLVIMVLKLPSKPPGVEKPSLKTYLKTTYKSINNRSVIGLLFAVGSIFMIQFGAFITYVPIFAGISLGASGLMNGIILCVMSLAVAISASQLGWLIQRFSEITLIKVSFIISAVALLIIPVINNPWLLLIPSALFGVALAFALPSSQALLAGLSAQDTRAGFMAVNASVQSLGQALGPILGAIAIAIGGIKAVFFSSAGYALIAFVIFNILITPKQTKSVPQLLPEIEIDEELTAIPSIASPTDLQAPVAQLVHTLTNKIIDLPEIPSLIYIGKQHKNGTSDIDISNLPYSEVVSRNHAQIKFDGQDYYIQDMGSSNGTYINKYPLLPGIWYKLGPGVKLGLGKRDMVAFVFQLN